VPYWHVDAGMAALLMLLSVVDDGLGACFFGVPGERVSSLREAFGVPDEQQPVGAVTIGHPAPDAPARRPRQRRPLGEVVHRGRW
jgi:nitroreductase